ncbi:MAG: EamA family transporter RarD, partial [Firmicutes bacterium]|nr:EamA family transporter RarD [Bacillota bacterium]
MSERRQGILAAVISNVIWGFLPLYWHALRPIESSVLIFYRIVLSAVVCWFLARRKYTREELTAPLKDRRLFLKLLAAGVLITLNWSLYIWAVNADHAIETSIGYYIEPVVVCLFGVLVFHDKLNRWKAWAFAIAAAGVAVIVLYYRSLPLISLGLALSFSLYGAMKKGLNQPALLSFFYETVLLSPFALIVILWLEATGRGAFAMAVSPWQIALLALAGICTATPLILFGESANKAGLFATGLIGYLSPTITLFLSIFVFHEPFELVQF